MKTYYSLPLSEGERMIERDLMRPTLPPIEACDNCKLHYTSSCPSLREMRCGYYEPKQPPEEAYPSYTAIRISEIRYTLTQPMDKERRAQLTAELASLTPDGCDTGMAGQLDEAGQGDGPAFGSAAWFAGIEEIPF